MADGAAADGAAVAVVDEGAAAPLEPDPLHAESRRTEASPQTAVVLRMNGCVTEDN
ncbi:hypothetical protein GCM10009663_32880 [Kitasatospora arboriphila]|uniref:Uncharacterized protein n=1 Tax=Kitasatospora arboriphila TaxID=258052 RepID=A0ABN1TIG6_9ACTN